jgi:hypothetical protein
MTSVIIISGVIMYTGKPIMYAGKPTLLLSFGVKRGNG